MTGTVEKLKQKYGEIEFPKKDSTPSAYAHSPTIYLFQKWAYRVEENWYGFDLESVPFFWAKIIDEFLTVLKDFDPNFKILQIKLKFGGVRFYVHTHLMGTDKKTLDTEVAALEKWLHHKDLIY